MAQPLANESAQRIFVDKPHVLSVITNDCYNRFTVALWPETVIGFGADGAVPKPANDRQSGTGVGDFKD